MLRRALKRVWEWFYEGTILLLFPLNLLLARLRRNVKYPSSVLHIDNMVHVAYDAVQILRRLGWKADYLSIGQSPVWNLSDYQKPDELWPHMQAIQEFLLFWRVVARYEIIHSHFMLYMSRTGWELPFLKKMGRKILIYYSGCEIRDRQLNMRLHPQMNICQDCDYNALACSSPPVLRRRRQAQQFGDLFLVTTPDMLDFVPHAGVFTFFTPEIDVNAYPRPPKKPGDPFKIVHVTAHPGIEGTALIQKAIDNLKARGFELDFVFLHRVHHEEALRALAAADLSIGKMKMGYYANAQIEAMFFGVPTITYVRPQFMTPELQESGFIFSHIDDLEATLEYYLTHPEALEQKRMIARSSILRLHDNERLGRELITYYEKMKAQA